jgi:signal transduction histidine kinase/pSer/pThr/pTyr-binding forkhead associated (FHA) protein
LERRSAGRPHRLVIFSGPGWIVPSLIVIQGADEGKQFDLAGDRIGLGRDASNGIRLHDTEVSRRHAELVRTPDGYRVLDVGSANGTFVNTQSVRDALLQPGDQVQIGQTILVFTARDDAAQARAADDLADRINLIARQDLELSSAIVKAVGEAEGSRILARPEQVEGPWLKNALANLRVMYEATQAVSHILDLEQLLERVMELIFRHLDADRGCIMLREPTADRTPEGATPDSRAFLPKAARWRDGISHPEKIPVSRTIVDYVLREKKGILISDAARDERFGAVQSIVRFGVREIICVPMKGRHETLGVLYLDTRSTAHDPLVPAALLNPPRKFTGDHVELAMAIAHQAALAVEETRYYQGMVQAERLAAVGQTIAALSHDVKNILQGLRSGSEILRMGLDSMDAALLKQGWKNIEKNQGKIYDLVMNMLSYSKEREPSIEETDLNALVREVLELLAARAAEKQIKLEGRLGQDLPRCPADRDALHRAVLNVVGNALDAVEEIEKPRVVVSTSQSSDGVWFRVQVRDNGVGIEADKLGEIFKPFVSTKGSRGTGLGLAVSRKILREHGGDILVQSQPGQGSLFTLRLPARSPFTPDASGTNTKHPVLPPDT